MKRVNLLTIATACLLLPLSSTISAHDGYGMGMMGQMDEDAYRSHMMQGRGMMDGMGMMDGQGMMNGMGPLMTLNLDDSQRNAIRDMQRDMQRKNWERMGEMMELRNQLQDIMQADKPDPAAAGSIYDKMSALRKQMFQEQLQTRNKIMDKLTSEQREQLRQHQGQYYRGRGMMME